MLRNLTATPIAMFLLFIAVARAGDNVPALTDQLKPFAPLLGKTWRGEFANSTPEKPVIDVARWERALNGKAIRVMHSVNDGAYGGETLIMWDAKQKTLAYWYFTTAGFRTEGTMQHDEGKFIAVEKVAGNANGISEVKSTSQLLPDGRLQVKAEYLKDGKKVGGREVMYKEAADAKVMFK